MVTCNLVIITLPEQAWKDIRAWQGKSVTRQERSLVLSVSGPVTGGGEGGGGVRTKHRTCGVCFCENATQKYIVIAWKRNRVSHGNFSSHLARNFPWHDSANLPGWSKVCYALRILNKYPLQSVSKVMTHLTVFGEFSSIPNLGKTSPPLPPAQCWPDTNWP